MAGYSTPGQVLNVLVLVSVVTDSIENLNKDKHISASNKFMLDLQYFSVYLQCH